MLRRLSAAVPLLAVFAPLAILASPARAVPFAEPVWLLDYDTKEFNTNGVYDYRPTIDFYDNFVIFERSTNYQASTKTFIDGPHLMLVNIQEAVNERVPRSLVPSDNPYGITTSARADWCHAPNLTSRPVAFSVGGGDPYQPGYGVYLLDPSNNFALSKVPNPQQQALIYPTWYPNCTSLAVYNAQTLTHTFPSGRQQTGPQTQKISPTTGKMARALSGETVWAGFASINPKSPAVIAFAGQEFRPGGYEQDFNYIYLADTAATPPLVKPLDPDAPRNMYKAQYQGRAPSWSPDGRWIVFESGRQCPGTYALFLQDAAGARPAVQLTACPYNAMHGKWYVSQVDGRTLLVATMALHPFASQPQVQAAMGIASLDITDFIAAQSAAIAGKGAH